MMDASMSNTLEQDEGKNNVQTIEEMFSRISMDDGAIKYIEKMRDIKKC
jgi:hypothetical protein